MQSRFSFIIPEKLVWDGQDEELGLLVPQGPLNPAILISLANQQYDS